MTITTNPIINASSNISSSQHVSQQPNRGQTRARRLTRLSLLTSLLCLSSTNARAPGNPTLRRAPQPTLRALNSVDQPGDSYKKTFADGSGPWLDFGDTQCPALVTERHKSFFKGREYATLTLITPTDCYPQDSKIERILVRQSGNPMQATLEFGLDQPSSSITTESALVTAFKSTLEKDHLPKNPGPAWGPVPFYAQSDLPEPGNITLSPISFPGSAFANNNTASTNTTSVNQNQKITVPLVMSETDTLLLDLPPSVRFAEPVVLVDDNNKILAFLMPGGEQDNNRRLPVLTAGNTAPNPPDISPLEFLIIFIFSPFLTIFLCCLSCKTGCQPRTIDKISTITEGIRSVSTSTQAHAASLRLRMDSTDNNPDNNTGNEDQNIDIENQLQTPTPINRFSENILNKFITQALTPTSAKALVNILNQLAAQGRVNAAAQFLHAHAGSDNFYEILAWLKPELANELVSMYGLLQTPCDYPSRQLHFWHYLRARDNRLLAIDSAQDHTALREELKPFARAAKNYLKRNTNQQQAKDALYTAVKNARRSHLSALTCALNLDALRDLASNDLAARLTGSKDPKHIARGINSLFNQLNPKDTKSPWHITAELCSEDLAGEDITKMIRHAKKVVKKMAAGGKDSDNLFVISPEEANAGMTGLAQILPHLEDLAKKSAEGTVYRLATLIGGFNHCATGSLEGISAVQQTFNHGQAALGNDNLPAVVRTLIAQTKQSAFERLKDIRNTLGRERARTSIVNDVHFIKNLSYPVNQLVGLPGADYEDRLGRLTDENIADTQAQYATLFNANTLSEQLFEHFERQSDQQVTIDMASASSSKTPALIEKQKANRAERPILAQNIYRWARSYLDTKLFGSNAAHAPNTMAEREERLIDELADQFDIRMDDMDLRLSLSQKTAWAILQAMKYIKPEYSFETRLSTSVRAPIKTPTESQI